MAPPNCGSYILNAPKRVRTVLHLKIVAAVNKVFRERANNNGQEYVGRLLT
jgi:hypothetical protein